MTETWFIIAPSTEWTILTLIIQKSPIRGPRTDAPSSRRRWLVDLHSVYDCSSNNSAYSSSRAATIHSWMQWRWVLIMNAVKVSSYHECSEGQFLHLKIQSRSVLTPKNTMKFSWPPRNVRLDWCWTWVANIMLATHVQHQFRQVNSDPTNTTRLSLLWISLHFVEIHLFGGRVQFPRFVKENIFYAFLISFSTLFFIHFF